MTDKALENAIARRDFLASKINKLQQQADELRRDLNGVNEFISDWHRYANASVPTPVAGGEPSNLEHFVELLSATKKRRTVGNSKKEDVAEAARIMIADKDEPMSRSELYQGLIKQGFRIEGTDPEMVLSTMLWRMKDRIVRLKEGGYWLPERPYPPGGYFPEIEDVVGTLDDEEPPQSPNDTDDDLQNHVAD